VSEPSSYRPITLVSCLGKTFTAILNNRLSQLSDVLNFYLPKNNRCYENDVYLSNISRRSFVLLAYPLLFHSLCIFCKKSCYVIIMLLFFSIPLYLFNLILNTGKIPNSWSEGIILPIYKNKGSVSEPSSYRPITLVSCFGKTFPRSFVIFKIFHNTEFHPL
jgi:hypothetical protein